MKKLVFSLILCFGLLLPGNGIASEEPASSEWKWKIALGAALTAFGAWMLGYFGKGSSSAKGIDLLRVAQDFTDAERNQPQLISDATLLFLVNKIKEDQISASTDPMKKTIGNLIGSIRDISDQKLGDSLENIDYLTLLKKKLESIRPEYYSAGLAKDVQEIQSNFFGANKLYKEVRKSLQYLGGYSGLVDDLNEMIEEKYAENIRIYEQRKNEAQAKMQALKAAIVKEKQEQKQQQELTKEPS